MQTIFNPFCPALIAAIYPNFLKLKYYKLKLPPGPHLIIARSYEVKENNFLFILLFEYLAS